MNEKLTIRTKKSCDIPKKQAKKQEQGIMSIMPFAMVGYLRFTSYDFIAMLYGNIAGRIFMSVCLIVVIVADYIAKRIVNIEI